MPHTETCPRCGTELVGTEEPLGYRCEHCQGHAFAIGQLRRIVDPDALADLWRAALRSEAEGAACPSCRNPMTVVHTRDVDLDVCAICHFVWFDAGETGRLPERAAEPEPEPDVELPEAVVAAMALAEAARARQRAYRDIPTVPPGVYGP